jgi:hypothetical protein
MMKIGAMKAEIAAPTCAGGGIRKGDVRDVWLRGGSGVKW